MKFRCARHTSRLNVLEEFYTQVLDLQVLGRFENHAGYDGVFLGKEGADWHLEFTQSADLPEHQPDDDDLLVFYPQTHEAYDAILAAIREAGVRLVLPKNPYWLEHGICVQDPDGYQLIISHQRVEG
ncbi:VOC family protein [Mangrovibacterium lignilyticum]|uniref:VOC family protein n=1 Tax=Mangrovibacterium lignilyticum TaxID=2668052 RepID=UPI0013D6B0A9|nr:VOC family protein [Mangrovibacterium lignilyticum]